MTGTTTFPKGPPSCFPSGVAIGEPHLLSGRMPFPDPTRWFTFFDDFKGYTAADWVVTETGVATQAVGDASGGVLVVTNAAADNDASFQQWADEQFSMVNGKQTIFRTRLKLLEVIQADMVVGLQIRDTSPLAVSDGIYFLKADASADVDLLVMKNGTATTKTAVATMVADTFIDLAFFYNGHDKVDVYVDGVKKASAGIANLPDDELLTMSFGVQNGEAVANIQSVDYLFAAQER